MATDLQGAVAVVTGGAGGIGRAIGAELASSGATVVLADVDAVRAAQVATELGVQAAVIDVTDLGSVRDCFDRVLADHGRLDVWVSNAGVGVAGPAEQLDDADWQRMLAINVGGVVHGVEVAYPHLLAQRSGHLVHIASVAGLTPVPLMAGYAMTKHAVVGLTLSLATEAAGRGVGVHVICPGPVDTPLLDAPPPAGADPSGADAVDIRSYLTDLSGPPIAPVEVGRAVVRAIQGDRRLTVVGARARGIAGLQRLVPGLVRRAGALQVRRRLRG
jgi:NAD(P)-dependent dehydrogenase (short-subunit alcohol dehydrogenase family)